MVVSRGIGDFYADAEGRGSDLPGYDWENDDAPDRTPDVWLDGLVSSSSTQRVSVRLPGRAKGPSSPRRSTSSATRQVQTVAGLTAGHSEGQ